MNASFFGLTRLARNDQDEQLLAGSGLKSQLQDITAREKLAREELARVRAQLQSVEKVKEEAAQRLASLDDTARALEEKVVSTASFC